METQRSPMEIQQPQLEVKFTLSVRDIPEAHRLEAENQAKKAYVMTLLRHADISSGRAAELLGIDRWQLSDLMDAYDISPFAPQTREELEQEVAALKQSFAPEKK